MDNSVELKKGRTNRDKKRALVAYSFIAPNFIGFAVFTLVPIVCAFALGFLKWDGNNPIQFVGLENFKELSGDSMFWASLKNTIIYCVGTVPLTMIASLALAIILNQKIKAWGFFRTVAFFPYVASLVAITAVWAMIFHPSKGPINAVLYYVFHMEELPNWFGKDLILLTLILFSVWKYMGSYMVIYLAGLQGVSGELYEAASLDGAGTWQKFRYVTWPQLRPTTFFVVVMLTINCFKVYDIAIMLPLSKPALSTLIIFTFVNTWNDYLGPLIYLKSEAKKTIQLGLKMFIGQYAAEYGLIMAGSIITLIPVLVVFLALQKYFVEGVAATGIKG